MFRTIICRSLAEEEYRRRKEDGPEERLARDMLRRASLASGELIQATDSVEENQETL